MSYNNMANSTSPYVPLVQKLIELNPGVKFELVEKGIPNYLACSVDPKTLKLPEKFYYNARDGITNLGNQDGMIYLGIAARKVTM